MQLSRSFANVECVTSIEMIDGQLKWRPIDFIWTWTGHVRKCMDTSVTGKIIVTKDTEKKLVRELRKSNNRLRRHTVLNIENISLESLTLTYVVCLLW